MKSPRIAAILMLLALTGCQSTRMASFFKTPSFLKKNKDKDAATSIADRSDNNVIIRDRNAGSNSSQQNNVAEIIAQAETTLASGDLQGARKLYLQAALNEPKNPQVNHGLAIVADQMKNYEAAERYYKTALEYDPNNADILANLGYSYLLQNRFQDSETYLKQALTAKRNHRKAAVNLGDLYGKMGDYDRALAMFRMAGSEAEAQANIARLFPNGRVMNAAANPFNTNMDNANAIAQSSGLQAPAVHEQAEPNLVEEYNDAPNDITRDLKMRMEQARLESQRLRDAKQSEIQDYQNKRRGSEPFTANVANNNHQLQNAIESIDRQPVNSQYNNWQVDPGVQHTGVTSQQQYQQDTMTSSTVPPLGLPGGRSRRPTPQQNRTEVPISEWGQQPKVATQPETTAWPATVVEKETPAWSEQSATQFDPQSRMVAPSQSDNTIPNWNSGTHTHNTTPSMIPNNMQVSQTSSVGTGGTELNAYEQAKRQAAAIGLGAGPGMLFPMKNQSQHSQQTTQTRMSHPPSNNNWNGGNLNHHTNINTAGWDTGETPANNASMTSPPVFDPAILQMQQEMNGNRSTPATNATWSGRTTNEYDRTRQVLQQEYRALQNAQRPTNNDYPQWNDHIMRNRNTRSVGAQEDLRSATPAHAWGQGQSQTTTETQTQYNQQSSGDLPLITPGSSR